jgi:hypothetical protein
VPDYAWVQFAHAQTKNIQHFSKGGHTMTQTRATQPSGEQAADKNAIRPFHLAVMRFGCDVMFGWRASKLCRSLER